MVGFLALLEGLLDAADQADVFVDDDAEGQDVLLRLAVVEVADAGLDVGEAFERGRKRGGELDEREGVEGGAEVVAGVG